MFFLQNGFFGGWPFKSVLFSVANNRNTDLILRKARMKEKYMYICQKEHKVYCSIGNLCYIAFMDKFLITLYIYQLKIMYNVR